MLLAMYVTLKKSMSRSFDWAKPAHLHFGGRGSAFLLGFVLVLVSSFSLRSPMDRAAWLCWSFCSTAWSTGPGAPHVGLRASEEPGKHMVLPNKPLAQTFPGAAKTLACESLALSVGDVFYGPWYLMGWFGLFSIKQPAKLFLLQQNGFFLLQKTSPATSIRFLLLLLWEKMA